VFCPKCGTEHPDDSQFCRKCGQPLTAFSPTSRTAAKPRLIIALSLGVVILLGLVWFASDFRRKVSSSPQPQSTSSASASASTPLPVDAVATSTSPSPTPTTPALSSEEIYKADSPGMLLIETYDDEGRKRGLGSGFSVASDGTTITNYHVIRGASRATVKSQSYR
jgi:S1-C subfamily serine protease